VTGAQAHWLGATAVGTATLGRAGETYDYVATHMMGQSPMARDDTVLGGNRYQAEPESAGAGMDGLIGRASRKTRMETRRNSRRGTGPNTGIAITEGHLSLAPRNANPILRNGYGVLSRRVMKPYQRTARPSKLPRPPILNGTRWTSSAAARAFPRGASICCPPARSELFKPTTARKA